MSCWAVDFAPLDLAEDLQLLGRARQPEQLLEVGVVELALLPGLEDGLREAERGDPGPDIGRPDPGLLGQVLDGFLAVALRVRGEAFGLLALREILPLQVLDEHEIVGFVVGELPNDGRNLSEAGRG